MYIYVVVDGKGDGIPQQPFSSTLVFKKEEGVWYVDLLTNDVLYLFISHFKIYIYEHSFCYYYYYLFTKVVALSFVEQFINVPKAGLFSYTHPKTKQ